MRQLKLLVLNLFTVLICLRSIKTDKGRMGQRSTCHGISERSTRKDRSWCKERSRFGADAFGVEDGDVVEDLVIEHEEDVDTRNEEAGPAQNRPPPCGICVGYCLIKWSRRGATSRVNTVYFTRQWVFFGSVQNHRQNVERLWRCVEKRGGMDL